MEIADLAGRVNGMTFARRAGLPVDLPAAILPRCHGFRRTDLPAGAVVIW
jgi:hypothetical protein